MHRKSSGSRTAIYLMASFLFIFFGRAGLASQWGGFKRFTHVWGSSTLSMATVVATFLAGLGIGAYLVGRIADNLRRPLRLYGFFELGIAALTFAVPYELIQLAQFASSLPPTLVDHPF